MNLSGIFEYISNANEEEIESIEKHIKHVKDQKTFSQIVNSVGDIDSEFASSITFESNKEFKELDMQMHFNFTLSFDELSGIFTSPGKFNCSFFTNKDLSEEEEEALIIQVIDDKINDYQKVFHFKHFSLSDQAPYVRENLVDFTNWILKTSFQILYIKQLLAPIIEYSYDFENGKMGQYLFHFIRKSEKLLDYALTYNKKYVTNTDEEDNIEANYTSDEHYCTSDIEEEEDSEGSLKDFISDDDENHSNISDLEDDNNINNETELSNTVENISKIDDKCISFSLSDNISILSQIDSEEKDSIITNLGNILLKRKKKKIIIQWTLKNFSGNLMVKLYFDTKINKNEISPSNIKIYISENEEIKYNIYSSSNDYDNQFFIDHDFPSYPIFGQIILCLISHCCPNITMLKYQKKEIKKIGQLTKSKKRRLE